MTASVFEQHEMAPIDNDSADRDSAGDDSAVPGVDKSGTRVREMFRQIAPRYDAMNHLLSLSIDRYWRWRAVRRLRMEPNHPVLDTCTGTGDLAIAIAKKAPPSVHVMGSDFCTAMLEIACQKRRPGKSSENIEFIEADSQALPFPENTFQCVTVAFGLRNVTDTDQGLREMVRVCTAGGQVVVLEFSQPRMIGLRQLYGFYFRIILPRIGQWFARNDKSAYKYLPESVGQFPDGQTLADRMTAAGMVQVRFTPMTFGVATIYEGKKPSVRNELMKQGQP
ncbi:bifunctional demethylmenaquinone methyltransferase/2-methoxy-6-polyprenyl-1,4-benzoquinol methylase UbiE [Novipirellula artificiosorum]|uniref:Demethylmenaquinone methyltransferase n=1 Tax=Novipirellula artificiosorum TaxID=2528016 RepID=A0A5C6D7A7_9BACT|nr:bifunctional demethylmenaquinone methyltransferase/2-methoxy-6-polyprenyl-1,4-benzoquinol methylase UbiE [Novipirellula artificiosorum]TWU32812.1 UbiE/COQ5 methyltransferase [Novipirellula artificiosorum]